MKAISLTQPWATLVAIGAKKFETRSWAPSYRGPIAIHAAKGFPTDCKDLCLERPFREQLLLAQFTKWGDLPLGAVVAIADLFHVYRVENVRATISENERAFGDYSDGRFAIELRNVRRVDPPRPAKGMLGIWEWHA